MTFEFKIGDYIGIEAAEMDKIYLEDCFIDTGLLDILKDCTKPQRIILGRTGSGKSTLLQKLVEEKQAISFEPEKLLFDNIVNSLMLEKLISLNINLLPFFKLIWRHLFFIEFATHYINWRTEEKNTKGFVQKIISLIESNNTNEKHQNKFCEESKKYFEKYLNEKNPNLWVSIEDRVTEFTQKYAETVDTKLGGKLSGDIFNFQGSDTANEEQVSNIKQKESIQNIINLEVNRDLNLIYEFTKEIFKINKQKKYYILIDKLDENWVSEKIRYTLIQALIETIKEFHEDNFKIIIALREDLLQKVYLENKNIQHEKYKSLQINVDWSADGLETLIDTRIFKLTQGKIEKFSNLLPEIRKNKHSNTSALEYIFERTFLRPRDVISFINCIINIIAKRKEKKITLSIIKDAEEEYSKDRFDGLMNEWMNIYPNLKLVSDILLKGVKEYFTINDLLDKGEIVIMEILTNGKIQSDEISEIVSRNQNDVEKALKKLLNILYKVGLVGFKNPNSKINYSYIIRGITIENNSQIYVHKMFNKYFKIIPNDKKLDYKALNNAG